MSSARQIIERARDGISPVFSWKGCMIMAVAAIAFANVVLAIFGNTIPNIVLLVFGNTIPGVFQTVFKVAASGVVLGAVFVFAMAWLLRAKPHSRPRAYKVVIFDVYGSVSIIDGLRVHFRNYDVAWSYMKQYKERYPLYNFALVSDSKESRPTIYRYI